MTLIKPAWLVGLEDAGYATAPVPNLCCVGLLAVRQAHGYIDVMHAWATDAAVAVRVANDPAGNLFSRTPGDQRLLGTATEVAATLCALTDPAVTPAPGGDTLRMPHAGQLPTVP